MTEQLKEMEAKNQELLEKIKNQDILINELKS